MVQRAQGTTGKVGELRLQFGWWWVRNPGTRREWKLAETVAGGAGNDGEEKRRAGWEDERSLEATDDEEAGETERQKNYT